MIADLATEREKINLEKGKAENTLSQITSFLKLITNNPNGEKIAKAILNPTYDVNDRLRFPGSSDTIVLGNKYLLKNDVQRYQEGLQPEQKKLIAQLTDFLFSNETPQELKENLKRFVQSGEMTDFARMEAVMKMKGGDQLKLEINNWTKGYSDEKMRLELERDFFEQLEQKVPTKDILDFLGSFEEKDQKDRELVIRLQIRALSESRLEETTNCLKSFNGDNYDECLNKIEPLAVSGLSENQEAARVISKILYNLELATYRQEVITSINSESKPEELRTLLTTLPERAPIEELDHVKVYEEMRDKVEVQLKEIININRISRANDIRSSFESASPEEVFAGIIDFPTETEEDIAVKQELVALYREYTAVNKPEVFDDKFGQEILRQIDADLKEQFVSPELGKNKPAFNYVRQHFLKTIYPLIESFRADPTTKKTVEDFLGIKNGERMRSLYEIRLKALESQRPLTDTERAYIESVQLLSLFNPYLVAATYTEQGPTSEFLRHHFETLSKKTIDQLKDGDYIPLIQIGTGPSGIAAVGEVVRNNPKLASLMLVVDEGQQPGGPFAIPGGKAWELNSANRRGSPGPTLPDDPNNGSIPELKKVRAYGSPLRWYPGERADGKEIRQGSINVTVDYLPSPDDLSSTARYPTNEDLQTIIALQSAMLISNLALTTKVISVRPNPDQNAQGNKLVTLQINEPGKEPREITITTDAVFVSSGLGDPTYGFKIEGSRAERVINQTKDLKGFPKFSTTLQAFKAFASRTLEEKESPGQTLVIYGGGNSADTLIEFVGSLFQGDNPKVRDVTKIYVVTEGNLSARPRYAAISDLKPRNGKGNLIEFVKARVKDVDFVSDEGDPMDRKLEFIDKDGRVITDASGKNIEADSAISAAGFKPQLDEVFKEYLTSDDQSFKIKGGENSPTEPVKLPTNKDVSVAETLKQDPTILFLGTASNPDFKEEKLLQLPPDARKALQRNGAENAVAIGFRAPDTQAAVNIWLNTKEINVEDVEKEERKKVALKGALKEGDSMSIPLIIPNGDLGIPDHVTNENLILTPLFSYSVGNAIEVETPKGPFTGKLDFELDYDLNSWELKLTFKGGASTSVSKGIEQAVRNACSDYDFQRYALTALNKKRRNRKIDIALSFRSGKLDPQETFVQN